MKRCDESEKMRRDASKIRGLLFDFVPMKEKVDLDSVLSVSPLPPTDGDALHGGAEGRQGCVVETITPPAQPVDEQHLSVAEKRILTICREGLGVPDLSFDEDFISDVGADSLRIAKLAVLLHNAGEEKSPIMAAPLRRPPSASKLLPDDHVVDKSDELPPELLTVFRDFSRPVVRAGDLLTTMRTARAVSVLHFGLGGDKNSCKLLSLRAAVRGGGGSKADSEAQDLALLQTALVGGGQELLQTSEEAPKTEKTPLILDPKIFSGFQAVLLSLILVPMVCGWFLIAYVFLTKPRQFGEDLAGEVRDYKPMCTSSSKR